MIDILASRDGHHLIDDDDGPVVITPLGALLIIGPDDDSRAAWPAVELCRLLREEKERNATLEEKLAGIHARVTAHWQTLMHGAIATHYKKWMGVPLPDNGGATIEANLRELLKRMDEALCAATNAKAAVPRE